MSGNGKPLAQRIAEIRERYGEIVSEATTLAKVNWEWLSTVAYVPPKDHRWLKMGLFEYDEKRGCYQNVVWGDMLINKKKLMDLIKENSKDGAQKD